MQSKKFSFHDSNVAIISLYTALPSWHGAADITRLVLKYLPIKNKKLFQFVHLKKNKKYKNVININILNNNPLLKFIFIFVLIFKLKAFFKKKNKKILIIEGASWCFFSFIIIKFCKILIKNLKIVYHSHNVEYEVRKLKNSKFIVFLTKIFEKKILDTCEYSTAVSKTDQRLFYKLYKVKTILLKNGVDKLFSNNLSSKINLPKNIIFFPGSYSYYPNKIAIDEIINFHINKIRKKHKNFYFFFSGEGFPSHYLKNKNVRYFGILNQKDYDNVLKRSKIIFLPLKNAPGTKLKTLQALYGGKIILCTKYALKGIDNIKFDNIFIYNKKYEVLSKITFIIKNFEKINKKIKNNKKNLDKEFYFKYLINKFVRENLNE